MILEHLEIYEGLRSVEGDRALAEFATVQLADEERRRAAEFEKLALTDPLTGLPNRRNVERWLEEAREQAEGAVGVAGQVSIAIIDLDHFKRINDTFSHESGDEVLRRVAVVLAESCLESDRLVARLGGEEFVQLGLGLTRAEALGGASRLLERLRCLCLDEIDPGLRITASIGVALGPAADPASLLKAADRCLYQAKRAGRNRIVLAAG
jgi:two-component system cell cycle response regulator